MRKISWILGVNYVLDKAGEKTVNPYLVKAFKKIRQVIRGICLCGSDDLGVPPHLQL